MNGVYLVCIICLNIYGNNEWIATSDSPKDMFEIINDDTLMVRTVNISDLGVSGLNITVLYELELIKNDKIISNIKVLSPKAEEDVRKINELKKSNSTYWYQLTGTCVILHEDFSCFA